MRTCFVYVTDERGLALAIQSALSVALSQRSPANIHLFGHRFVPRLPACVLDVVAELRVTLELDSISDEAIERHQTHGHVTKPTLLKLLPVDRLAGRYDRIVYLDNDMLVFEHLAVDDIQFGSAPLAAVIDMDLSATGWTHRYRAPVRNRQAGTSPYFNAGLLMFESRNWRAPDFGVDYARALIRHDGGCSYKTGCTSIDQCALNDVFTRNWVGLPASYNMQASAKFTRWWKSAKVRHYCGPRKFLPLALFRNDLRDIRYLNEIGRRLGHPETRLGLFYEVAFMLNTIRQRRRSSEIGSFLQMIEDGTFDAATAWA